MVWTVPFVVFGIGRYLILQSGRRGDDPTLVLLGKDPWFLANTLARAATVAGPSCCSAAAPLAHETD